MQVKGGITTDNFIPCPFFPDDVSVDISFVFADEKPAGKHGFLQVQSRDLVFEDGTKVKFWGCFPEHKYAEKLARRLAKIGLNLVRFHQLDAWLQANSTAAKKPPTFPTGTKATRSSLPLKQSCRRTTTAR